MTHEGMKGRRAASGMFFSALKHLLVWIWVLVVLIPIIIMVFISFKTNYEYAHTIPIAPPGSFFNFANYKRTLIEGHILKGMLNSFILVVFGSGLNVMLSAMTSYCLSRFEFAGKKVLQGLFILSAVIPNALLQVVIYQVMHAFRLTGTFGAPIVLYAIPTIVQVWIYLQFLDRIPYAMEESAMLDGASFVRIFFRIIFPLFGPATATVLITQSIMIYDDMFTQYLYMSSTKLQTATTALMTFSGQFSSSFNVMAAGCVAVMVPTVVIFLFFQKQIFAGLTIGSVKG